MRKMLGLVIICLASFIASNVFADVPVVYLPYDASQAPGNTIQVSTYSESAYLSPNSRLTLYSSFNPGINLYDSGSLIWSNYTCNGYPLTAYWQWVSPDAGRYIIQATVCNSANSKLQGSPKMVRFQSKIFPAQKKK